MLSVNDVYKLTAHTYITGAEGIQAGLITVHYRLVTVVGQWSIQDIANAALIRWQSGLPVCYCSSALFYGVELLVRRGVDAGIKAFAKHAPPLAGSRTASSMPTQVAVVISKLGAQVGRKNRGRAYLPFPASADVSGGGNPSTTYLTVVSTNMPPLLLGDQGSKNGGADTYSATGCLFSVKTGQSVDIVKATVTGKWGTQRRRGMYGRVNVIPNDLL